jgi:hypothetical protein
VNFQNFEPIEAALAVLLYVALTRGITLPPVRVLLLIGLLHLALQHSRHQMVAGVVGALALAEPFAAAGGPAAAGHGGSVRRHAWAVPVTAALVLVVGLTALRAAVPVVRLDDHMSPIQALDHVPAALAATPVFNDYGFGGYLIFRGIRPFIDGRADLYGDDFLDTYAAATGPSPAPFEHLADQYGIRWTIVTPGTAIAGVLDRLPGWRRLYADSVAVVHERLPAAP